MPEQLVNGASSTLNGAITNVQSTITIQTANVGAFPPVNNFRIAVTDGTNTELMLVTGGQGTATWTVTRAVEPYGGVGTAFAFASGSSVAQVLTSAGFTALAAPALPSPVKFAEVGPLAASQASAVFSSLPSTYRHARIKWQGRCDQSAAQTVSVQFNGDTGTNYEWTLVETSGTTQASGTAQTGIRIGIAPGTGSAAGRVAGGIINIENYTGSTFFTTLNAMCQRGDGLIGEYDSGDWLNTAAVTSISIILSAGNFIAGSVFTLYLEP